MNNYLLFQYTLSIFNYFNGNRRGIIILLYNNLLLNKIYITNHAINVLGFYYFFIIFLMMSTI